MRSARLGVVDEIFLRTHRGMGTPIALQGLWRTADPVDPVLLERVHAALAVGELGRRVVRPRVPGARRGWRPNVRAHPLVLEPRPVADLLGWADGQGFDLDPEFGPGWRLAAAPLPDGGTVVALTCSHALADARGLVIAVDRALARAHVPADGNDLGAAPATPSSSRADTADAAAEWADALHQWTTVIGGTARAALSALRPGRRGAPGGDRHRGGAPQQCRSDTGNVVAHPVHSVVAAVDAATWDRVAAETGGTANSLFIHLVAQVLLASGFPRDELTASLPVDTRDEPRVANDLAMTSIVVRRSDTPATVRAKARAAYERRMTAPAGLPEEILQVVPDRVAHAMARGAGERDILCSNIGDLPDSLLTLGESRCTGVAARAIHPGLDAPTRPRTRLSGYLCRIGGDYTLCLVALDPPGIDSPAALRDAAVRVGAELRLPLRFW
nr:hypothetical protein [Nocardia farcinica]